MRVAGCAVRLHLRVERVGRESTLGTVKRVEVPLSNLLVEGLGFQQYGGQEELVRKLLMPLFPQARGDNDENLPLAFSPSLRQEDACLDCLAKSDEIVKTEFKPDDSVEVELVNDDAQELEAATTDFVRSWRRFREIDASLAATSGANLGIEWWRCLEYLALADSRLKDVFCGRDRSPRSIKQYHKYRLKLIDGKHYRTDA